ncbi:MAG: AAA family ATPase, partial [Burkholderiales bacterium]
MYLTHFGLAEFPFNLTPDTAFSFASGTQREALDALRVAVDLGEGFVKVVGEVGTGKTLTCRRFIASQPERTVTAYLPNPSLAPRGLMTGLAAELGISAPGRLGVTALRERIERKLLQHAAAGRGVVVCLDEAQTMPDDALEQLRLLSNLETEKSKLMQVVMFGQPELDRRMARDSL